MLLKHNPLPHIVAEPLPRNMLEWHYVMQGLIDTPYSGGYYHGKLEFPLDFPFRPPAIYMLTPNGRFHVNRRLCLSMSDFHPNTWNPTWSVSTILTGLLSFMLENTPTQGSINTTSSERKQLAKQSLAFNLQDALFREMFPALCEEMQEKLDYNKALKRNKRAKRLKERMLLNEMAMKAKLAVAAVNQERVEIVDEEPAEESEPPVPEPIVKETRAEKKKKKKANKKKKEPNNRIVTNSDKHYLNGWQTHVCVTVCFLAFLWVVQYIIDNA